jgi:hypothetical protein
LRKCARPRLFSSSTCHLQQTPPYALQSSNKSKIQPRTPTTEQQLVLKREERRLEKKGSSREKSDNSLGMVKGGSREDMNGASTGSGAKLGHSKEVMPVEDVQMDQLLQIQLYSTYLETSTDSWVCVLFSYLAF